MVSLRGESEPSVGRSSRRSADAYSSMTPADRPGALLNPPSWLMSTPSAPRFSSRLLSDLVSVFLAAPRRSQAAEQRSHISRLHFQHNKNTHGTSPRAHTADRTNRREHDTSKSPRGEKPACSELTFPQSYQRINVECLQLANRSRPATRLHCYMLHCFVLTGPERNQRQASAGRTQHFRWLHLK